jgi:hypothetical protein
LLSFGAKSFVFSLLCKNLSIQIYRTIILPFVLYGCETWSETLREECRLRVFDNGVLWKIVGPMKKGNRSGENYIMRSLKICRTQLILFW